jgi:peptidoglycan/LPS O-acetylase OafA/YrhL
VCLGVILAHLLHSKRGFDLLRRFVGRVWVSPVAFLLLTLLILFPTELTPLSYAVIYAGMAIVVASCVIREDHLLNGILSSWPARLIGTVSYGMYLLHMLTYNAVKKILTALSLNHALIMFAVTLIAATFVAWLSYRYYETFFLRMKSRFSRTA